MRMRSPVFAYLVVLCLSACSFGSDEREQLIETIESSVKLHDGAWSLDHYERYYTSRNGVIEAAYILHVEGHQEGVLEECKNIDDAPFPCPIAGGELRLVDAGKSTWVDDANDLPVLSDGGCDQVSIMYDPDRSKFLHIGCNAGL